MNTAKSRQPAQRVRPHSLPASTVGLATPSWPVLFDVNDPVLVIVLSVLAFGGLFASLIAARASDRVQLAHGA